MKTEFCLPTLIAPRGESTPKYARRDENVSDPASSTFTPTSILPNAFISPASEIDIPTLEALFPDFQTPFPEVSSL